jgi:hypothetical protein
MVSLLAIIVQGPCGGGSRGALAHPLAIMCDGAGAAPGSGGDVLRRSAGTVHDLDRPGHAGCVGGRAQRHSDRTGRATAAELVSKPVIGGLQIGGAPDDPPPVGQVEPSAAMDQEKGAQRTGAAVPFKLGKRLRHVAANGTAVIAAREFEVRGLVAGHGAKLRRP